jgi:hypothetical protein
MSSRWLLPVILVALTGLVHADGPADNPPDKVRPIPPRGYTLTDTDRTELSSGVEAFGKELDNRGKSFKENEVLAAQLADVRVYESAVRSALAHDEFFNANEVSVARRLLKQGL